MLESYNKKILPKIKEVLSVQETIYLDNGLGDKIQSILDLVITWEDGKRYVADNKTSSIKYENDSAKKSPQLMGYYHAAKNKYKIDGGVAFFVLDKAIKKNRVKKCSQCYFNGTGTRYKTCNNQIENSRCDAEWIETISPEAIIEPILNEVNPITEALVLHTYDEATKGIKAEMFGPNLNSCGNEYFKCSYYNYCYFNDKSDLLELKDKKE